jgi:hypothetical protein
MNSEFRHARMCDGRWPSNLFDGRRLRSPHAQPSGLGDGVPEYSGQNYLSGLCARFWRPARAL